MVNLCKKRYNDKHIVTYCKKRPGLLLIIIITLAVAMFFVKIAYDFKDPIHDCLYGINREILGYPFVNSGVYYLAFIIISIVVTVLIYSHKTIKIPVRNKGYISELLKSEHNYEPAVDRKTLKKRIYGKGKIPKTIDQNIKMLIDENINHIKTFIIKGYDNVLVIDAKWGAGKTTNLLIAINEIKNNEYRYIYESAFKYRGNNCEYVNDILLALSDTLYELGIEDGMHSEIASLISNIRVDDKNYLFNLTKDLKKMDSISSELVFDINERFKEKQKNNEIILMIDDLDRLDGEGVIRVLSLLSVIRRLTFVKIIIPADLNIIYKTLENSGVVDSVRFMEKYLPSQKTIIIKSSFEIAQNAAISMLCIDNNSKQYDADGVFPALAAVYISLLSKIMKQSTANFLKTKYPWLANGDRGFEDNIGEVNEKIRSILNIPFTIQNANSNNGENEKYSWEAYDYMDIRDIQNVVYALKTNTGSNGVYQISVRDLFTDKDYIYSVRSWIFKYIEEKWDILGLTIRDVIDCIDSIDHKKLPNNMSEQFAYVFNQLFPKQQLKLNKDNKA